MALQMVSYVIVQVQEERTPKQRKELAKLIPWNTVTWSHRISCFLGWHRILPSFQWNKFDEFPFLSADFLVVFSFSHCKQDSLLTPCWPFLYFPFLFKISASFIFLSTFKYLPLGAQPDVQHLCSSSEDRFPLYLLILWSYPSLLEYT